MQEIITNIMNQFGYFGVFMLITIENIIPPIPSELILTFGGFMTLSSNMNVWGVILSATLGSVAGAIILYGLGHKLSNEQFEHIINGKLGKLLRLKKEHLQKADRWIEKYGTKAIFIGRFIPMVRSLISIPAGMSKMKIKDFLVLTTLGTFIWNVVLVYSGRLAGEAWVKISTYYDLYTLISSTILVAIVIIFTVALIRKKLIMKIN